MCCTFTTAFLAEAVATDKVPCLQSASRAAQAPLADSSAPKVCA